MSVRPCLTRGTAVTLTAIRRAGATPIGTFVFHRGLWAWRNASFLLFFGSHPRIRSYRSTKHAASIIGRLDRGRHWYSRNRRDLRPDEAEEKGTALAEESLFAEASREPKLRTRTGGRNDGSRYHCLRCRRQAVPAAEHQGEPHGDRLRLPDLTPLPSTGPRSGDHLPRLRSQRCQVLLRLQDARSPRTQRLREAAHAERTSHARQGGEADAGNSVLVDL